MTTWLNSLKQGDYVNAQDKYNKWYVGIIKEIHNKTATINFLGFGHKFNEHVEFGDKIKLLNICEIKPMRLRWILYYFFDKLAKPDWKGPHIMKHPFLSRNGKGEGIKGAGIGPTCIPKCNCKDYTTLNKKKIINILNNTQPLYQDVSNIIYEFVYSNHHSTIYIVDKDDMHHKYCTEDIYNVTDINIIKHIANELYTKHCLKVVQ